MKINFNDELLDEFILINLIGLYTCYENDVLTLERMQHWLLNGKISKLLKNKCLKTTKDAFESFEETMRFSAPQDKSIINFEESFKEIKDILLKEIKQNQKETSQAYFFEIEE